MRPVRVRESIYVDEPPGVVWDFTQDYAWRDLWDNSVISARVMSSEPLREVRIKAGVLETTFRYKQYDRPRQSSLVMTDTRSWLIKGGGGSWQYTGQGSGTVWTQTNSLIPRRFFWFLRPLIAVQLKWQTKRAMRRAKQLIEASHASSS